MKTSKFVCHFSVLTALLLSPMPVVAQRPLADFVGTYADGPKHRVEIAIDAKGQLVAVVDDAAYPLRITGRDELTNNGGGRYSDQRGFITRPDQITVKSNFGGSATATVTT